MERFYNPEEAGGHRMVIQTRRFKTGNMPNAPDAMRVGPRHFTGTKKGDDILSDFLGDIGALGGQAKEAYDERKKK